MSEFRFTQRDAEAVCVALENLEYDVMNSDSDDLAFDRDRWAIRRLRDLLDRHNRRQDTGAPVE